MGPKSRTTYTRVGLSACPLRARKTCAYFSLMPSPAAKQTRSPVLIRPRQKSWDALCLLAGIRSHSELATELNVTENTVWRVMTGQVEPSPRFITGALVAFPFASFDRLFELYRRTT